jgi:cobalt-zinc-cadmium efflux system outer membrane protein
MHAPQLVTLLVISTVVSAGAEAAQGPAPAGARASRLTIADAVRLALEHNHSLRAQRLEVDLSKADEITAGLKPNPVFTSTNEDFPVASLHDLFSLDNLVNNQTFVESVSYLFERGGKRKNRILVAEDTTRVAARTASDAERQLVFQTRQAFINVLLANSVPRSRARTSTTSRKWWRSTAIV